MTAVTSAWAQRLYLDVSGTSATLKYSANSDDYSGKPSFTGTGWDDLGTPSVKNTVQTITVDATTCGSFGGDRLINLFYGFLALTSVNLSGLNTSSVTDMSDMFGNCSHLTSVDLSGLNTSNVTTMQDMFNNSSQLTSLDLSGLNTSSVTNMSYMFRGCTSLQTVNLSGSTTSSVTDMSGMFRDCTRLTSVDISRFNTSNVTTMKDMFNGCSNLTAIFVGADWSVASIAIDMFNGCTNLPNWDGKVDGTHANTGADGYLNKIKVTANLADGAYWATFYNVNYSFQADANTKVFKVEQNGTYLTLHEVEDRIVNSVMPVVLKSTGNNIVMTKTSAATSNTKPNSLSGWAGPGDKADDGGMYVLNYTAANGVGFYKLKDGKSLSPGKAFLYYDGVVTSRDFFGFNETTGIESVSVNKDENFESNEVYDLQGRRVSLPTKGLYIVNGKKVFIK